VVDGYGPIDFSQLDAHRDPSNRRSDDPESLELPPGTRAAHADSFESLLVGGPIEAHPDRVRAANPLSYHRERLPPFLILHGSSDMTVPVHQSELLFDALAARGADVTLCVEDGLGHGFLIRPTLGSDPSRRTVRRHAAGGVIEPAHEGGPITYDLIEHFFARVLRPRNS